MANVAAAGNTASGGQTRTSDESANDAVVIIASDSTKFIPPLRGIYVGVAGNIQVITAGGTTVLFSNVPAGFILPVEVQAVMATNTTATTMIGLI